MSSPGADVSGSEVLTPPSPSRALAPTGGFGPPAAISAAAAPGGPELLHGGFNQTWLMNCLRRRWLLALCLGSLIGALTSGLLLWLFPETSRVTALLEVKPQAANPMTEDKQRPMQAAEIEREANSQLALIKSPMVLAAALQKQDVSQLDAVQAHLSDPPVNWMLNELKVSFPGESQILEVRYEGEEDPEQMVKVIQAIVDSYRENVLMNDRLLAVATQDDLQIVLDGMKTRLQKLMEDYKNKSEVAGVMTEEVEVPKIRTEIQMLEGLIATAKKELVDIEVMKQLAVQSARSPAPLEQQVQYELNQDPAIANYKQSLFSLEQAIQQRVAASRNREDSTLKRLVSQRDQTKAMMDQARAVAEKEIRDRLSKIPNEGLRQAIIEHDIRFKSAQAQLKEYEDRLQAANKRLMEMGVKDPEIEMLANDIENEKEVASTLEQKIQEFRVTQNARARRNDQDSRFDKVRLVQPPQAQTGINSVERILIALIGGLGGLALTCYGVALMEFRHRRLNSPSDIDEGLGVRVLGVLPPTSLKALTGRSLVATQVAESIDNVRASLMHGTTSQPRQVILITSPATLEGRTIVAASLALSLARAGRRTLLVDADVRSPSLHRLFGMSLEDGLCEVLRSQTDLADAVKPTNSANLYLLSGGVCDHEAIHALATDVTQTIVEKMRDQFDYVIIDGSPALGLSDCLSIGKLVDGAILTVLRDHSEVRSIHQTVEQLKALSIRLLGVVVNGVPIKADRRVVRLHQASMSATPRLPAATPES